MAESECVFHVTRHECNFVVFEKFTGAYWHCSVLIMHVPILIIDNNLSMGSKVSTLYLIQ